MATKNFLKIAKNYVELVHPKTSQRFKVNSFWLRDHCRCDACYNVKTHQRTLDILKIPPNINPTKVKNTRGDIIHISWNDGHTSEFSLTDLCTNLFENSKKENLLLWDKSKIVSLTDNLKVPLQDLNSDLGIKKILNNILRTGIGLVTNVENTLEATESVVKKIFEVQKTFFGEMWKLSSDLQFQDLSYTNVALEAHHDNTYFTESSGLQVFHMLNHEGAGGETLLVDGFNAANNLKDKHPEAFDTLCKTPITAEYIDKNAHYFNKYTAITLDPFTKELQQVRYNYRDRAFFNTVPQEGITTFYDAYRLFGGEITDSKNEFQLKLQPGSVIFIDNWRVLHGRAAFTGKRELCGCYVSRSDFISKGKVYNLI